MRADACRSAHTISQLQVYLHVWHPQIATDVCSSTQKSCLRPARCLPGRPAVVCIFVDPGQIHAQQCSPGLTKSSHSCRCICSFCSPQIATGICNTHQNTCQTWSHTSTCTCKTATLGLPDLQEVGSCRCVQAIRTAATRRQWAQREAWRAGCSWQRSRPIQGLSGALASTCTAPEACTAGI